jgi:hypothetical protein
LKPGKRSFDYRTNWNGGVGRDKTGEFYFMVSGGAKTTPTATNPSKFAIKRREIAPHYEKIKVVAAKAAMKDAKMLSVSWEVDTRTTPPFAYHIKIFDNKAGRGEPLATASRQVPHARSATVDVSSLKVAVDRCFVHLECVDILDRRSDRKVVSIGAREKK